MKIHFGATIEDLDDLLDQNFLTALGPRGIGLTSIDKFVDLSKVWPAEDRWYFRKLDHDITAIITAGMEPCLRALWIPSHAAEGKPTFLEFAHGSSEVSDGTRCDAAWCGHKLVLHDEGCFECSALKAAGDSRVEPHHEAVVTPKGKLRFAVERDYVRNPPQIDSTKLRTLGATLAKRYPQIARWSAFNEWDSDTFNPYISAADVNGGLERMLNDAVIPFIEGVLSVLPNAVIDGPDASTGDGFRRIMDKCGERFRLAKVHRYFDGDMALWHHEMNHYVVRFREWGAQTGRDVRGGLWLSEYGDRGGGTHLPELIHETRATYGDVLHGFSIYMTPADWPMLLNRSADGWYTPNANGLALKAAIAEINGAAAVDPELERLRKMERDHAEFERIVTGAMGEFRGELADMMYLAMRVGQSGAGVDNEAHTFLIRARRIKEALAAKQRSVRR